MGPKVYSFDHIPALYTADPAEPLAVHVIAEAIRGSGHKYAYKSEFGIIELRRILRSGMVWPCDFGFIPQTLCDDGDALDVALLINEPCFPGCLVRARLLGFIGFVKDGVQNDRLLACPISLGGTASVWDEWRSLEDVPQRTLRELEGFLRDYQTFEGIEVELTGIGDAEAAMQLVKQARMNWKLQ